MPRISKYFKFPTFLAPQSHGRITWVVETERDIFLEKRIITLSPVAHIKLDTTVHAKSHHFSLLPSILLLFIHCLLHRTCFHTTMTDETNWTSNMPTMLLRLAP
jgi:hypothetical protein